MSVQHRSSTLLLVAMQDLFPEALSVALQHPALAADQRNICRLVQVCKAWRSAVQQSTACLTDIVYSPTTPAGADAAAAAADWAAFADWVSTYAGIIRSIDVGISGSMAPSLAALARRVVSLGMKAANGKTNEVPHCSKSAYGAHAATAVTPHTLRLQSFTCTGHLASPATFAALPAATLSQLVVKAQPQMSGPVQGLQSQLSSLQNLESLHLEQASNSYLSSIKELTKLTDLTVYPLKCTAGLDLLPQKLRRLELGVGGVDEPVTLNLSHLTQLTELSAEIWCPVGEAKLPQLLQRLSITSWRPAIVTYGVTSLQQLRHLSIMQSSDAPQDLTALRQMSRLQTLEISYDTMTRALQASPAWQQLQQLEGLQLAGVNCTATEFATIMEICSTLTALTKLVLSCEQEDVAADEEDGELQAALPSVRTVCNSVKQLIRLQRLVIDLHNWDPLYATDVLHLSGLTSLTSLQLHLDGQIDSAVITAVLLELINLQHLHLSDLKEVSALPVIGKLQGLTHLSLLGLTHEAQQCFWYLARLRKLQQLHGFEAVDRMVLRRTWPDTHF